MSTCVDRLRQIEFEARIFVSFGLAAVVTVISEVVCREAPSTAALVGAAVGASPAVAHRAGFAVAALVLLGATAFRMWAGSVLTSTRVMAFGVQSDALLTRGPYRLSRNPIYLADLTAFVGFALVMKPVGLLLPVLLYGHYRQLIAHEEKALEASFGDRYQAYLASAPRLLPDLRSVKRLPAAFGEVALTRDGIRHNALYVLFLPGLAVAACTGEFWHAVAVGLPGALDWAVVHTRIGLPRRATGASGEGA